MARALTVLIGFSLVLSACTPRTICPAFQSAFIYDKDALRKKFSYFQQDSTPKVFTASKTKYLVAEPIAYSRKLQKIQTIDMKDVNPVVPDSLSGKEEDVTKAELDSAANSIIDSIYVADVPVTNDSVQSTGEDSVYVITKSREVKVLRYNADSISYHVDEVRYNIDQDNYMWYLRDVLVLPDVRLAQLQATEDKEAKKRVGIKGFFKNLFKKKKKEEETDSLQVLREAKSEFDIDYVEPEDSLSFGDFDGDSAQQTQKPLPTTPAKSTKPEKKKREKKRDKKKETQPANKEESEPIIDEKKEDDDGGF